MDMEDLRRQVAQRRRMAPAGRDALSEDDCMRAIAKLKALGSGFEVMTVGSRRLVRSVPTELQRDHNDILQLAEKSGGHVRAADVEEKLAWSSGRVSDGLHALLKEGLAMVDDAHPDGQRRFWFPCVGLSSIGGGGSSELGA
eukprot:jgi/Mesen1/6190/ME000032S05487